MNLLLLYAGVAIGAGAILLLVLIDTIRTARRFGDGPEREEFARQQEWERKLARLRPPVARPNPAARNVIGLDLEKFFNGFSSVLKHCPEKLGRLNQAIEESKSIPVAKPNPAARNYIG